MKAGTGRSRRARVRRARHGGARALARHVGKRAAHPPGDARARAEGDPQRRPQAQEGRFLFPLTFSGHGGQVDDVSRDEDDLGDQADKQDETWCLFDAQLIDDGSHW